MGQVGEEEAVADTVAFLGRLRRRKCQERRTTQPHWKETEVKTAQRRGTRRRLPACSAWGTSANEVARKLRVRGKWGVRALIAKCLKIFSPFEEGQRIEAGMFTPPLYKQRYQFVKDLVEKHQPKKVADLGCASCSLMWTLKFCKCIEELVGLDISEVEMKERMHTLAPLPCDFLQPGTRCLSITLYQGSIAEKDPVLLEFDMVASIELIEHLEEAELKMFPEVVFGFMTPAVAVISTPNSEYNYLLPRLTGFRDPDHKFEWKREEFQRWASCAAEQYGYTVQFTGVGEPPPDAGDVGYCTQIAVFVRNFKETAKMVDNKRHTPHVYRTVFKAVYPSLQDEKYLQIAVINETMNQVQRIKRIVGNPELITDNTSHHQLLSTEHKQWPFGKSTVELTEYTCVSSETESNSQTARTEPFVRKSKLYVPLAYLFATPKVKLLCGTFDVLVKMVAGKLKLSRDGSAVKIKLDVEQDTYFI